MPGIENITAKILKDAEEKAGLIIEEAREKARAASRDVIAEANREKERIDSEAETLSARVAEHVVSTNILDIRNKKLQAKQTVIKKILSESLKRLCDMESGAFEKFVSSYCKDADIKDGDLIILPEKYKSIDVSKINPKLARYEGSRSVSDGFVLVSGGIEQNNTFTALLDLYKNDLAPEIISLLHPREEDVI